MILSSICFATSARTVGARGFKFIAAILLILSFAGCVTYIPVEEYNVARTAYDAAKDADAPRYAPAQWFKTEQLYRDAEKAYGERDYRSAKNLFKNAKENAERAENIARLARHQSGDVVP